MFNGSDPILYSDVDQNTLMLNRSVNGGMKDISIVKALDPPN